jgi:hypothetical protein
MSWDREATYQTLQPFYFGKSTNIGVKFSSISELPKTKEKLKLDAFCFDQFFIHNHAGAKKSACSIRDRIDWLRRLFRISETQLD